MCEPSFAVRCLTRRLNLSAFGVRSAAVLVVVVVVVIGPGHVNLFLSETMNGASSVAPPTDRQIDQSPLPNATTSPYHSAQTTPAATAAYLNNSVQRNGGRCGFDMDTFRQPSADGGRYPARYDAVCFSSDLP